MGIQINGQTDIISAVDGGLTVSGADFTGVSAGSTSAPSISPTGDSNTGIFFPSPDTVAIAEGGVEALRVDNSGRIIVAASTLLTATAGAVEYDGRVVYSTPAGRGVSPSMMFYRLNSGLVGASVNTAQNILGAGVTLQSSTIYAFECIFVMSKTSGTVSHNIGLGFGGTATINNILYMGSWQVLTASTLPQVNAGFDSFAINTASNTVITGSSTTSSRMFYTMFSGTVSINAGGTFIPQYTLSAAPGGAYTTFAGSYFAIWPIGAAGSDTSVGPWI